MSEQIQIDRHETAELANQMLTIIRTHLRAAIVARGPTAQNNFEVLNALAICGASLLASAPPSELARLREWFDNALSENIADMRGE